MLFDSNEALIRQFQLLVPRESRSRFLEPSYGIALGNGNKKSVGLTGGIFFAVP
jgi:hypothetical protein